MNYLREEVHLQRGIKMEWKDIIKDQRYHKGKKNVLNGLYTLRRNITANMLEHTRSGPHYLTFDLDKKFDGFYFDFITLKTNMDWLGSFDIREDVVSIIKELRESDLSHWSMLYASFEILNSSNVEGVEEIQIRMRRTGE